MHRARETDHVILTLRRVADLTCEVGVQARGGADDVASNRQSNAGVLLEAFPVGRVEGSCHCSFSSFVFLKRVHSSRVARERPQLSLGSTLFPVLLCGLMAGQLGLGLQPHGTTRGDRPRWDSERERQEDW